MGMIAGREVSMTAVIAGLSYFAILFAAGFALGTLRMLVPLLGESTAVLLELPVMLTIAWFASRWACTRFAVPAQIVPRLIMGELAFVTLLLAELLLSLTLFGRTAADHLATYGTPIGLAGLLAQALAGAFPLVQAVVAKRA
jgi:hypothetical protein